MFSRILTLLYFSTCFIFTVSGRTDTIQSVSFTDHAEVALFDSLMLEQHFAMEALFTEKDYEFSAKSPEFDEEVFERRMAYIDSRTPLKLEYNPHVKRYIDVYTKERRKQMSRMLGMSKYYFPIVEPILDKYGLPQELKYLMIVESAFNSRARSRAGAAGLWQFMYSTGKGYGLMVSSYVDERNDPIKSTEAACKMLKKYYNTYNDWSLALAAYNCGRGNVNKAIRRSGGKMNYWQIRAYLPRETRSYVPAFMAVNYAMNYYVEHEIAPNTPRLYGFEVDTVKVKHRMNFDYLSNLLDISVEELEFLNPSYKLNVIPYVKDRNYVLCLPIDKMGVFTANESDVYAYLKAEEEKNKIVYPAYTEMDERIVHKVKSGEFLGKIARKYDVSVKEIKKWNGLKSDRIKTGQRLVLYVRPDRV